MPFVWWKILLTTYVYVLLGLVTVLDERWWKQILHCLKKPKLAEIARTANSMHMIRVFIGEIAVTLQMSNWRLRNVLDVRILLGRPFCCNVTSTTCCELPNNCGTCNAVGTSEVCVWSTCREHSQNDLDECFYWIYWCQSLWRQKFLRIRWHQSFCGKWRRCHCKLTCCKNIFGAKAYTIIYHNRLKLGGQTQCTDVYT